MGELAGFAIPRLGMGTMALAIEGRPDRDTAIRTIHAGLDAGVRYLDTAWSYYLPSQPGTGTAEDLGYGEKMVRDALASWDGPRDEVLIATKTGYRRTMEAPNVAENEPERQHLQAVGSQYGWMADSRPETMICDAKESAAHLGVEALDLLYSHGPDPEVAYEDQVGALKQLLDEGVIRDAEYGADITLRTAFPAGTAETFQLRLTELSAGSLAMTAAGEEFLPGPREEAN